MTGSASTSKQGIAWRKTESTGYGNEGQLSLLVVHLTLVSRLCSSWRIQYYNHGYHGVAMMWQEENFRKVDIGYELIIHTSSIKKSVHGDSKVKKKSPRCKMSQIFSSPIITLTISHFYKTCNSFSKKSISAKQIQNIQTYSLPLFNCRYGIRVSQTFLYLTRFVENISNICIFK